VSDCYLPRLGGIEVQVANLAERQAAAGHEVTVITSTGLGGSPEPLRSGVAVERVAGGRAHHERIRYLSSLRSVALVRSGRFDVVHLHASSFSPLAFLAGHACASSGVPVAVTVHSLWARATPLFVAADRLVSWGDWPMAWSAVSRAAAAPLRRVLGPEAEITIVPNGVEAMDWKVPRSGPAPGSGRAALRVVSVARLASRKRPVPMARMLKKALALMPRGWRLEVEVVGDGPERPHLERYLKRHGMTSWVKLHGRLDRLRILEVYRRADLFVAPATLESFGIAALEARCAGLPVLARAGTGVADFVTNGVDGWLVDGDDQMAEQIADLARHPSRLASVAAHNRSVPCQLGWDLVLAGCEYLYQRASLAAGSSGFSKPVVGLGPRMSSRA